MKLTITLPLGIIALAGSARSQVVVDGTIAGDAYGPAVQVQFTQTQFGDNLSELNAAYMTVEGGRLFIALTGNLESNFNKLEIFVDSQPGGENVFTGVPGNDNTGVMTGLTFDMGFEADYHIILRRGSFMGDKFDIDIAELGTANFSSYFDVFGGTTEGSGTTGTGPANASPIEVAYDDSNVAGILSGIGVTNQANALAVLTGMELSVDLADLGSPGGIIKFCIFVNGSNHDFASNQFFGSVGPPQSNLGGDGFGNFNGLLNFDLNSFAGDQFFDFAAANPVGSNYCLAAVNSSGSAAIISGLGSASISSNDLTLVCLQLPTSPDHPGIFIAGPAQAQIPFFNGFLCVDPVGLQRFFNAAVSVGGVISEAVDYGTSAAGGLNVVAGSSYFYQRWFRDPVAGGGNANFSDGLEVVHTP
ncbi:MAG: hypothetical protein E2O39_04985 [Planctomycetota bacterium]|nr:MAG: hypothetical protein E2O39_04985 [Planctomycetota bacterium]